eukprot:1140717-Pelagomonas_calceolata.AAC.2
MLEALLWRMNKAQPQSNMYPIYPCAGGIRRFSPSVCSALSTRHVPLSNASGDYTSCVALSFPHLLREQRNEMQIGITGDTRDYEKACSPVSWLIVGW